VNSLRAGGNLVRACRDAGLDEANLAPFRVIITPEHNGTNGAETEGQHYSQKLHAD
jgi:hypothetical protein